MIVVKVTGADSPSVWFEMDGWMESEKEERASGLVGVKKKKKEVRSKCSSHRQISS